MAMLPFCGYHMGDYFQHYLNIGKTPGAQLPKIFYVNWFRQDESGKYLWPGYGENSRVLEWIFERCNNNAGAVETPIGLLPEPKDLDTRNLALSETMLQKLLSIDTDGWLAEVPLIRQHFEKFGDRLPKGLTEEIDKLDARLKKSK
jgi:phosphoenolpyruvate carboxykinase (GTP)